MVKLTVQERVQKRAVEQVVNVSVEIQRHVPLIQEVQGTMEVPQGQYIDRIVDVTVCCNTKYNPSEQCTSRRTVKIHEVWFIDRIVEVLVVMPRPARNIQYSHVTLLA